MATPFRLPFRCVLPHLYLHLAGEFGKGIWCQGLGLFYCKMADAMTEQNLPAEPFSMISNRLAPESPSRIFPHFRIDVHIPITWPDVQERI